MRTVTLVLCVVLLGGVALDARAEEDAAEVVRIEIEADSVPVVDVMEAFVEATDINLLWHAKNRSLEHASISGPVVLEGTREEMFAKVRALLLPYELVVIALGSPPNTSYFVADARATTSVMKLKAEPVELSPAVADELATQDGRFVTTVIRTQHIPNLREVRNALQRIVTGQNIGNVTEIQSANALVVTDFAPNVAAIYRLIQAMDVPESARTAKESVTFVQVLTLRHADAGEAAAIVEGLLAANAPPAWKRPVPQQAQVPDGPVLRVEANRRLNQLFVHGTIQQIERVSGIVSALDQPPPTAPTTVIEVIRLEHVSARDVAGTLQQLIGRSQSTWQAEHGGTAPTVVATHTADALVIQAPPDALQKLRRVIADLDRPEPEAPEGE